MERWRYSGLQKGHEKQQQLQVAKDVQVSLDYHVKEIIDPMHALMMTTTKVMANKPQF